MLCAFIPDLVNNFSFRICQEKESQIKQLNDIIIIIIIIINIIIIIIIIIIISSNNNNNNKQSTIKCNINKNRNNTVNHVSIVLY